MLQIKIMATCTAPHVANKKAAGSMVALQSQDKRRAFKQSRGTYLGPDPEVSVGNKLRSLMLVLCFQVAVQHANTHTGQGHHESQHLPHAGWWGAQQESEQAKRFH